MGTEEGRILIVDDDEPFRVLVSSLLERAGYATAAASTGEEALASVRREMPSCILLDVLLPQASGYEVCRELRDEYGEALPIVFVTGERTEPADRVAGLIVGADDYILKPFDPDELIARVRRLLVRSNLLARLVEKQRPGSFQLTDRELDVLRLLADGLEQNAIARELFISPKTVSTHIQRILTKLGVHSRAQAIALAYRENLIQRTDGEARLRVMH
jgi:two-component system, NarL family, nitrate/nitrite response regulator NarL